MQNGYFTFVLHAHLPYVLGHGKWPHGTDWLNEATVECYIPLLRVLDRLAAEGVRPAITLGLTPVLCEQLAHPVFAEHLDDYLQQKITASEVDEHSFAKTGDSKLPLAKMWRDWYVDVRRDFHEKYHRNVVAGFRKHQDEGRIEIITCAATHGYLPLLGSDEAVRAQVRTGVAAYKKHFGRAPAGIWLPECAYRPAYPWTHPIDYPGKRTVNRVGLEEVLWENGISYFIVDSHLLQGGKAIGAYIDRFDALKRLWGQFEKSYTKIEGAPKTPRKSYLVSSRGGPKVAAILVRDADTALQVWSGEHGYPGDGAYLDFHKKHFPGGNRYWRVTGAKVDLGDKKEYDPSKVTARLDENAGHFKESIRAALADYHARTGEQGVLVAPFDTELFGHWWFEGPEFIYHVCKWVQADPSIKPSTGGEIIRERPPTEIISIPEGSWGEGGYHYIWFNEWTSWTWKHVYEAEDKLTELATKFADSPDELMQRLLRQLAREVLLLESSDWQFLISTWSARDYAEARLGIHNAACLRLAAAIEHYAAHGDLPATDRAYLEELEDQDCLFGDVDPKLWVKSNA
jgi:1,4-alpha-glucan branching enzyme